MGAWFSQSNRSHLYNWIPDSELKREGWDLLSADVFLYLMCPPERMITYLVETSCQSYCASSVSHAICLAIEANMPPEERFMLSRRFMDVIVRENSHDSMEDTDGLQIVSFLRAVQYLGVCSEELCPSDEDSFRQGVSQDAYIFASQQKKMHFLQVDGFVGLKNAIAMGLPVIVGTHIASSGLAGTIGMATPLSDL